MERRNKIGVQIVSDHDAVIKNIEELSTRKATEVNVASNLTPSVFVVDAASLKETVTRTVGQIAAQNGEARIVVIGERGQAAPANIQELVNLGVNAWVRHELVKDCLMESIRAVACGMQCFPTTGTPRERLWEEPLTDQEDKVYDLLRRRYSNREIAVDLGVQVSTAKAYVASILKKCNVNSRLALAFDRPAQK